MLNIIYGANASGKTKVLKDLYKSKSKKEALCNIISNIYFDDIDYSSERLEKVNDNLDYQEIEIGKVGQLVSREFSAEFLDIAKLLLKDVDYVYLDEPDIGLVNVEVETLIQMLHLLKEDIKELWVVTHDSRLYAVKNKGVRYWNINEVQPGKFQLLEV